MGALGEVAVRLLDLGGPEDQGDQGDQGMLLVFRLLG